MAYADHYERALTNGVLSIQRGTEPGIMIYFLPMNPGGSKAVSGQGGWGTPTASFWCCYGTGPSNVSVDPIQLLGHRLHFSSLSSMLSQPSSPFRSSGIRYTSRKRVPFQLCMSSSSYRALLIGVQENSPCSKTHNKFLRSTTIFEFNSQSPA